MKGSKRFPYRERSPFSLVAHHIYNYSFYIQYELCYEVLQYIRLTQVKLKQR